MEPGANAEINLAVQAEQIANIEARVERIDRGVEDIRADLKGVPAVLAVHSEQIGMLRADVDQIKSQVNWGKWLGGVAAAAAALVAYLKGVVS